MIKKGLWGKFLLWRVRHIKTKNFVLLLSVLVGFVAGLAAVIIKNTVHLIQYILTHNFKEGYHNYGYIFYPTIGILLAIIFMRYIIKRQINHGVPGALYAISKLKSVMKVHNMYSSIVTSSLTVGFGGSVGLEGPTVATGAAIGSNLGKLTRVNYKTRTLLIGCAGAGAMASIFNAPIAAVVFAMEVLMLDLTMASIIPLLMASASAKLTSMFFLGDDILFHFDSIDPFTLKDLPFYILLGILAGLVSMYFSKTYFFMEERFSRMKSPFKRLLLGGGILGLTIFLVPVLYGEGYSAINTIVRGDYKLLLNNSLFYDYRDNIYIVSAFLVGTILLKAVAASATFGAGGIGGIFAPTLFMGGITGFVFSKFCNHFSLANLSSSNFTLVGMAGLIAGVLQAPLTAVFLLAELTKGYELFLPLMITSAIAYTTIKYFLQHSVYTYQLAQRGELITHDKDKAILKTLKMDRLIETNIELTNPEMSFGDLVKKVTTAKRNIFPVIDDEHNLLGVITLDDIRGDMFNQDMYDTMTVADFMREPKSVIDVNDGMEEVISQFEKPDIFNITVLKDGKYVGVISKQKLFTAYRRVLKYYSED